MDLLTQYLLVDIYTVVIFLFCWVGLQDEQPWQGSPGQKRAREAWILSANVLVPTVGSANDT